jgi:hypothetical protein
MTFVPSDGRLTSLNPYPGSGGALSGGEVMYIVSPGNQQSGQSFQITTLQLATYFNSVLYGQPTFITSGSVYDSVATDIRILVDLTIAAPLTVLLLPSANYTFPVLVKDIKGTASPTNPITVTFSSGQEMDGLSSVVIDNPYGYFWFNPLSTGGWYDAAF